MKTFFAALIIIIGAFFYIFTQNSNIQEPITLEEIDKQESMQQQPLSVNNISIEAYEEPPKFIPQNHAFDEIRNIIKDIKNINHKTNITLNTQVSSYIYIKEDKEKFKNSLATSFGISYDEIDKEYKKRKLVWDWVNYFEQ